MPLSLVFASKYAAGGGSSADRSTAKRRGECDPVRPLVGSLKQYQPDVDVIVDVIFLRTDNACHNRVAEERLCKIKRRYRQLRFMASVRTTVLARRAIIFVPVTIDWGGASCFARTPGSQTALIA